MYGFPQQENDCVTATSQIYAHKKRPSVFIQEYRIHNPSVSSIVRYLEETLKNDLKDFRLTKHWRSFHKLENFAECRELFQFFLNEEKSFAVPGVLWVIFCDDIIFKVILNKQMFSMSPLFTN